MGNAIGVQILQGVDDFSDIENLNLFGELADIQFNKIDELASFTILLYKVEICLVLEGILQLINAGVLHSRQQLLLHHSLVLLFFTL